MLDALSFSRRIAELRKAKGFTQDRLGQLLGVTAQAVSKWERAETLPDLTLVPSLCQALEVNADRLLDISTPVPKERMLTELQNTFLPLNYEQRFLWLEEIWRAMVQGHFGKRTLEEWNAGGLYSGAIGYSLKGFSIMLSSEYMQESVKIQAEDVRSILRVLDDETHLCLLGAIDSIEHRTCQQLEVQTGLSPEQVASGLLILGQQEWLEASSDGFRLSRKRGVLLLTILSAIQQAVQRPSSWISTVSHPNLKTYRRKAHPEKDTKMGGIHP